jgi:hypothetical protein
MGGRRGCSDVVVTMDGGIVFNQKDRFGISYVEWVGYDVEEVQMPNWLSMKEVN